VLGEELLVVLVLLLVRLPLLRFSFSWSAFSSFFAASRIVSSVPSSFFFHVASLFL
jgi:hypothetical protein